MPSSLSYYFFQLFAWIKPNQFSIIQLNSTLMQIKYLHKNISLGYIVSGVVYIGALQSKRWFKCYEFDECNLIAKTSHGELVRLRIVSRHIIYTFKTKIERIVPTQLAPKTLSKEEERNLYHETEKHRKRIDSEPWPHLNCILIFSFFVLSLSFLACPIVEVSRKQKTF